MPDSPASLVVRGAREHNLKSISCELPRDRLVVITGPSGSGKSSLAFDTIYAEGQRRYVESLSAYARQFLDRLPKPNVDGIEGLSPSLAIEQRPLTKNPRSTVGTVTEIADYLRLLFARIGVPHSPSGAPLKAHTAQQIVDLICQRPESTRLTLLAPIARSKVGNLHDELETLRREGFVRVQLDGVQHDLSEDITPNPSAAHDLAVVIDRIVVRAGITSRVTDSVELALRVGQGTLLLDAHDGSKPQALSESWINWDEGVTFPPLEPALLSFNSPLGCCAACAGLGTLSRIDPERIVPDPSRTLRQGAVLALGRPGSPAAASELSRLVSMVDADPDVPWRDLPAATVSEILDGKKVRGTLSYEGVLARLGRLLALANGDPATTDEPSDEELEEGALSFSDLGRFVTEQDCPSCGGTRLGPQARAVRILTRNIAELCSLPLPALLDFFDEVSAWAKSRPTERAISTPLLAALKARVGFLVDVGLSYLTLDRLAHSLSGGEGQRIRLATQLGTQLVGVLYVLDEPSVGLHPRDNQRLLKAVRRLVDHGNSVLLVEHDRDAIFAADYLVDMGPGAGNHGGEIVASGPLKRVLANPKSVSAPYLNGTRHVPAPAHKPIGERVLRIVGARKRNLKNVSVDIPLGVLTAVTGVSGSGKSTLIMDTLHNAVREQVASGRSKWTYCDAIEGLAHIDRLVSVDQSPIGRSPRSNPASYTGILSQLRELFAALPEAKARGYRAGRFSFNIKGGRCETCQGEGVLRIEMHFLPDVFVNCEACQGARYNRETLEIRYKGHSIADVLRLTVEQATVLFAAFPKIRDRLAALQRLGLGYLQLGQAGTTLSGGEAQRLKLATELARPATGRTLYLLDEPTTGLHFSDIEMLLVALFELRDANNSVLVIEHNLDLIARADWIIDLGPDGGPEGGQIIAQGTPEAVAKIKASHTGQHLAPVLAALKPVPSTRQRRGGRR
jgi:excinuclease ABC subunit A